MPIAGHGEIKDNHFHLTGLVAGIQGAPIYKSDLSGAADASESIGISLAETLLSRGADKILEQLQTMESANEQG